uniref:basic salivary proline-rich protein 2-like n=1 Tax=Agelaius phoeniceus TaxID=39638 RepID=UPI0023EC619D|nr:basic salivary proline-rich protein 2-like [Agelaius phoeniceus]
MQRAGPGTGPPPADGGRLPADRPRREGHASSGAAAARHEIACTRGPPPPEGPPSARPHQQAGSRARGRLADNSTAGARSRRKGHQGEERCWMQRHACQRPRQRVEERERRWAPGAAIPRLRKGREGALSAGVAHYGEASGWAPMGHGQGGTGHPSLAQHGLPPRRGRDNDSDGGAQPVATGQPLQGIGGSSCSPPLSGTPHGHRPVCLPPPPPAGHAEPPKSLNCRLPPPAPFGKPTAFDDAEGKKLGGPPRRGALGTWPWGEGNDLHGPTGVPPLLLPLGSVHWRGRA